MAAGGKYIYIDIDEIEEYMDNDVDAKDLPKDIEYYDITQLRGDALTDTLEEIRQNTELASNNVNAVPTNNSKNFILRTHDGYFYYNKDQQSFHYIINYNTEQDGGKNTKSKSM